MRPPKPKNHLDSFRYAVEGIVHVFRTQRHMRFHIYILVVVLLLGILCNLPTTQMAILVVVVAGVLVAEMFNTAIESVVDMITQTYHPLAKLAKDIAAGAVLAQSVGALMVGVFVFSSSYSLKHLGLVVNRDPIPVTFLVTLVVVLLVLVMAAKILGGKGSILSGGVVSGHAAVAFFLAETIIFRASDWLIGAMALLLAVLVSQSRVEGKVHTMREVVFGGLLGLVVTSIVYFVRLAAH